MILGRFRVFFVLTWACTWSLGAVGQSKTPTTYSFDFPADENPRYFPSGVLDQGPRPTDFIERWYSANLRAAAEPSLFEDASDKTLHVYRFLWLRSFHHAVVVRVTIQPDGTGMVVSKIIGGAGGYKPEKVIKEFSAAVTASQIQKMFDLIQKANFWTLRSTEEDVSGVDGAQWVIEGLQGGKYLVVDRWSPRDNAYSRLCDYLLNIGKVHEKPVY
jgi:hypothetical protein